MNDEAEAADSVKADRSVEWCAGHPGPSLANHNRFKRHFDLSWKRLGSNHGRTDLIAAYHTSPMWL
jgi:hypothetical protein